MIIKMTESPNIIWAKISGIWYHIVFDKYFYINGQIVNC